MNMFQKVVFIILSISSAVQGFMDYNGTNVTTATTIMSPTGSTSQPIACFGRTTQYVIEFCNTTNNSKKYRHPLYQHWYIDCTAMVCNRCDPHDVLLLQEECQQCLREGAVYPDDCAPVERNTADCSHDGCDFCTTQFGTTAHNKSTHYCQCVWDRPWCMSCPCLQKFDAALGCCVVDHVNGRQCNQTQRSVNSMDL